MLIVEAPEKSGALITARQAADQGRDVFVVPGNIDVYSCAGSNALLQEGAYAALSGWDVVKHYENLFPGKICRDTRPVRLTGTQEETVLPKEEEIAPKVAQKPRLPWKNKATNDKKEKNPIDNKPEPPYSDLDKDRKTGLSEREEKLLALIGMEECLVDDVIARSAMAAGVVLAALTMLEVKGLVTRLPGRRVRRKG